MIPLCSNPKCATPPLVVDPATVVSAAQITPAKLGPVDPMTGIAPVLTPATMQAAAVPHPELAGWTRNNLTGEWWCPVCRGTDATGAPKAFAPPPPIGPQAIG